MAQVVVTRHWFVEFLNCFRSRVSIALLLVTVISAIIATVAWSGTAWGWTLFFAIVLAGSGVWAWLDRRPAPRRGR